MKNIKRLLCLSLLGGLTFLLIGCNNSVNTVGRQAPIGQANTVASQKVTTDSSLGKRIAILQVAEGTASGDLLKIQVLVQNTGSKPTTFNYKFEWYDIDGFLVSGPTSTWKAMRLMGKESKAMNAIAPSPKVVDFTLKLEEPK